MGFDENGVEFPESQCFSKTNIHHKKEGIFTVNPDVNLVGENDDDPELSKIDIRKLKNNTKKPKLDIDQFILVGFSEEEAAKNVVRDKLSNVEDILFEISNLVYNFTKEHEGTDSLFEIYTSLAEVIVRVGRIKKGIKNDRRN